MRVIHKFQVPAPISGLSQISVPGLVQILSAQEQHENVVLYATVENGDPIVEIQILAVETGNLLLMDDFHFINTVMMQDGNYVLHIFWKRIGDTN